MNRCISSCLLSILLLFLENIQQKEENAFSRETCETGRQNIVLCLPSFSISCFFLFSLFFCSFFQFPFQFTNFLAFPSTSKFVDIFQSTRRKTFSSKLLVVPISHLIYCHFYFCHILILSVFACGSPEFPFVQKTFPILFHTCFSLNVLCFLIVLSFCYHFSSNSCLYQFTASLTSSLIII